MFSIFHDDNFNEQENKEDTESNANYVHSFQTENIQEASSSKFSFQKSSDDSRKCQISNNFFDDAVNSDDSDSEDYDDILKYSQSHKNYQEKCDYSTNVASFKSWDVVKSREYIDHIVNCCSADMLKEIEQIKSLSKNCQTHQLQKFKDRMTNFYNQQREFEKFVSTIKSQFTPVNIQNLNFEKIIKNLLKESIIFKQFFPAYAFRQDLLSAIEKNQVVVINSSQIYSSNAAIPLILSNVYHEYSFIVCEPNEIVSYILQEKINFIMSSYDTEQLNTEICVLSEKQLLKRCSYTTHFAGKNSCIMFSVPLKRSVITDIILSNLRDLLVTQKHSKLILLLSPHDDASKFADYFSLKLTVSLLKFPSLTLPVKTTWKSAISYPHDDFKDDVVKTIFSVHAAYREPGDIIVFLPSLEDVQLASEKIEVENGYYHYNNLKIICIDDKLEDILKSIKSSRNFSERRVFLLINNYEGIVIPFARFVIDCGIQKEYYLDSESDTNIIIPTFICQGRAKMRKDLAGVCNNGVCFRLYNKTNYLKNMTKKEYAEIFCINPIQSIVMALQHCPQKRNSIQFVESLPNDMFQNTLSTLKAYGAIDKDLSLTSLGENMVKLPLPVKYSRFILLGIQSGFAFEAIILVAFFLVKSRLFVQAADGEHQRLIDLMKLDFNQLDSDTFTYLNIYKLWKENGCKKIWCMEHFINYETLKSIHCKVNEIIHLIPQYLGQKILQKFSDDNDKKYLIQTLFECFHNNLCTYSGHPRIGYRVLSTGKYALIHSSSLLSQKDNFLEFVIYEDLISSEPSYIKHLTCIPFDIIMDYLQQGKLNFDSSDLFDYKLVEKVIEGIGDKVISRFLPKNDKKKIGEVENKLKKETNVQVALIEPVLEKGSVNLYAFPDDIDKCFESLKHILSDYIQAMTNEEEIKVIEFTYGQNKASFEAKWIKGAEIISATYVNKGTNRIPLLEIAAACAIESTPDSSESSSINYTLKIFWPRLVCTGEGYVNFKSQNDFHKARLLAFKNLKVRDYEIFVQVSNVGKNQMHVSEIPANVTKTDIENVFSTLLPGCKFEVELCYTPPFETSDRDLEKIKKQIEENCIHFSNITSFEVKVLRPSPSAKYMTAYVNVFEKRCLKKEAKNLSETKVNNMKLSCEPLYFSELKCSIDVYNAIQYCIKEELDIFLEKNKVHHKRYSAKIIIGEDYATIKLSSDDIDVMKLVQMHVNHIINGIRLDATNLKGMHKLFCHGGHMFLKTLGKTKNVHIVENYEAKIIRLFGPQENCNLVRQYILDFLKDTENEVGKDIILSSGKQNRLILKTVITQYGANLEKFIESCGLRSAALNLKTSCLSVCGTKRSVEKAEECIKELSSTVGFAISNTDCDSSSEETCPICFLPPESLSFRLQYCGHLYCNECIKGLIEQAKFPLICERENCSKPITLGDIKYIMDDDVEKIKDLVDKSLKAYLNKNKDKIYYCPAADCSMFIYKNEVSENKWNCPLCKNYICMSCNVVYHEGFSCDMYRGSKEDPDYSFKEWQKGKQCKQCPKCHIPIEKTEGCNHMSCFACLTHFCWICLQYFPTDSAVYTHIGTAHPGQLFMV